jgi:type I restriction enzyme S subunit
LWLKYWFASADGYKQLQMHVKEKHLVKGRARGILLPLPPLAEQRRIVARIEELMGRIREARRLRQEAQKDAERLWQSVLAQTFPRPGSDLPEGWRWVRLEEVCEIWDSLRKPVKKKYRHPGNVPYCGANGVIDYVDGFTHFGEFVLLAEDGGFYGPGEFSAYMMKGRFWANNHVHILRGKPDQLLNHLLYHWLVTCDLRPFLTGATRPKLTQGAMRSILIPLPPLAEQRRIVAHLEAVQERLKALKEAQAATEAELKRLEQAILEKAFRGEL